METSPYLIFFSFAKTTHGYARVDAVGLTERENSRKRVGGKGEIVGRKEWDCLE